MCKGYLFCQIWYIKEYGVGPRGGASPYETLLSTPRDTSLFPLFRTKQSLFDLNVIINVKLMFSATTVIFSVFTFCLFCFFDKVLLVLIQSEYTNLFLPKALRNYMFLYPQLYDLRFIFIIISIIYFSIMFIFSGFNFAKLLLLLL